MHPDEESVTVGQIRGPWGLRGDLKVESFTDFQARFSPGSTLYIDGQPTCVERARPTKSGFVVKLDIADDRTAAEALRDRMLTVPRNDIKPLPADTYYYFQIIDMAVFNDTGGYLGKIKEILPTGTNDVYVVVQAGHRDLLIPALADVVLQVDPEQNRMTVRLPEGLVEARP